MLVQNSLTRQTITDHYLIMPLEAYTFPYLKQIEITVWCKFKQCPSPCLEVGFSLFAITCVSPNVNINLCRFYVFCDFWFPHVTLFFLYRSSLVVTTSLTPECPSVLSQFLFWLLTTSPTSKPHTTTAELLIWLSTTLLLSRHYIILNDLWACG